MFLRRGNKLFFVLSLFIICSFTVSAQGIDVKSALGLNGFSFFGSTFITVILVIVVSLMILGLSILALVLYFNAKKYKFRIPLYNKIGNIPTRIAVLKSKPVSFGKAGDQLWFVKGKGIKKWIPPATIQSAKNEFWHWIREDGEWVNFCMTDLDEMSKKAGINYVKQDARLTRLAIERLLEQRFNKQGFWEKWGVVIGYVIFFLIITVALVIFFHQYGKTVAITGQIMDKANQILERAVSSEGPKSALGNSGLVPVNASLLPLILFWRKHGS